METLLGSIQESRTIWAWTDDHVEYHITREELSDSWDGLTDEEIAELLAKRFSVCVWAFCPIVKSREAVFEDWEADEA